MKILGLCLLLIFSGLAQAENTNIKNVYILLDPVSHDNERLSFTKGSLMLINEIASEFKENKLQLKNLIIHVVGAEDTKQLVYSKKDIDAFDINNINNGVKKILTISGQGESKISTYLASYSMYLKRNNLHGAETIFIIFSDINYKNSPDLLGGYLNSAFLDNKKSPFVTKFLATELAPMNESSIIVFTRSKLNIDLEKGRKIFIANLFEKANQNIKILYIGETQNNINNSNTEFSFNIVKKAVLGEIKPITVEKIKSAARAQIIKKNGGGNVDL